MREGKKSFLAGCWIPEPDDRWGGGSYNYNRWMESNERTRLPDEAARVLEPIAGEKNFISTPERLSQLIREIGEDKVINAIHESIKDR